MIQNEADLLSFLDSEQISYERIEHPAVFTCDEAEKVRFTLPAVSTKNLFMRASSGQHYLIMTACAKRLDMKSLAADLQTSKLQFGSETDLAELLGVTRGAVTVLGLVNDRAGKVKLFVDEEIWMGESFLCHPLVNTSTLVISKQDLERFLQITGHRARVVPMP